MRTLLTTMTFPKMLALTVAGAIYVGLTADLPPKHAAGQRQRTPAVPPTDQSAPCSDHELIGESVGIALQEESAADVDVKPLGVWRGALPENHAGDGRKSAKLVTDRQTWQEVWNRLRGEEPPPSIDFSREVVVLGTIPGSTVAAVNVRREADGKTRLTISGSSATSSGGSYILARFERGDIDFSKISKAVSTGSNG